MSERLKQQIRELPNNELKDIFIGLYEAIEWIINILNEEIEK